jgi:hypothetical protein
VLRRDAQQAPRGRTAEVALFEQLHLLDDLAGIAEELGPVGGEATPRVERTRSARPTRASRSFIAADIVGCATYSTSAAAEIDPSAATSMK